MVNNIYKSMAPLSVCCLIFGFSTIKFRRTRFNRIMDAYCWLVTIICFTVWSVAEAYTLLYGNSFIPLDGYYLILDAARTITLTYYRIKYIQNRNFINCISRKLKYVDERLKRSVGLKVRHTKNLIICIVFMILVIAINLAVSYIKLKNQHTSEIHHVILDCTRRFAFYSKLVFVMNFVVILYNLAERLRLVRYAIVNLEKTAVRKSAWKSGTCFSVAEDLKVDVIEKRKYLTLLKKLQRCVYDIFVDVNNLYKQYFYSYLILSIFGMSLSIISIANGVYFMFLFSMLTHTIQFILLPLCLCMNVANEFYRNHSATFSVYHTNHFKPLSRIMKHFYYDSFNWENDFECGCFKMDWKLMAELFSFIPLFVFFMLSLST